MENLSAHTEELIFKFLQHEATETEIATLQRWLQEDERHRNYFEKLNDTFQATVTMSRINPEKIDHAWKKVSQKIEDYGGRRSGKIISLNVSNPMVGIAATISIVVILSCIAWLYSSNPHPKHHAVIHNNNKLNTRIVLPDGSIVWLNTNSTLEYSHDFGLSQREVLLKGEAFFDVKKDDKRFIVKTQDISIHVKGTRFNVRAYADEADIKTTLEEGKVELEVPATNQLYIMQPGEQITVNANLNTITRKTVDPLDFSSWKEEKLVFDDTPLADIVHKLENRFNVNIIIKEAIAQRERLTMTIENETIDEVLEFIHLSSRLKYRKEKNLIFIYE